MNDGHINRITSIKNFLEGWDKDGVNKNALPTNDDSSEYINKDGSATCNEAFIYKKNHAQFIKSLEKGIRDLVVILVNKFNCVTISSCQGHHSVNKKIEMQERRVCILPRNRSEYLNILKVLNRAANLSNKLALSKHVAVLIKEDLVTSCDKTEQSMPCITIVFTCTASEKNYFSDIESLYDAFLAGLKHTKHYKKSTKKS